VRYQEYQAINELEDFVQLVWSLESEDVVTHIIRSGSVWMKKDYCNIITII